MASTATRGCQSPRPSQHRWGQQPADRNQNLLPTSERVYLSIVDQHTAPLVQFLHDLQDGHLNIHLHTLLYIRHLADPGEQGEPGQEGAPPGPPSTMALASTLTSCEPPWCSSAASHACPRGASPVRPGACAGSSLHLPGTGI